MAVTMGVRIPLWERDAFFPSSSSLLSSSSSVSSSSSSSSSSAFSSLGSSFRVRAVKHKDEGEFRTTPIDPDSIDVPIHTVTVHDRKCGIVHQFQVPEDQYILHTAEYQDINLPFSCRHGCCTACAVRVKSGELYQPQALGISPELKAQGYALLCVGYPLSDLEVETQDEDEVYWLQFGQYFAGGPVERDDYALELAVADE